MSSDAGHLQFSDHIWQTVGGQAKQCLLRREFCPEQSRIDNLRCVHFEEEAEQLMGGNSGILRRLGSIRSDVATCSMELSNSPSSMGS